MQPHALPCNPSPPLEGFVIVSAMVRLLSDEGMTVERAVRRFADCRPPGIYKAGERGVKPHGWEEGKAANSAQGTWSPYEPTTVSCW